MALWRIVDDDDRDVLSPSAAGCQSYTHWTAGLRSSSDDDDDDDGDGVTRDWDSEPTMKRLATTTQHGKHYRPLHVPSYYRMKPVCVKLCEKAEKVRAFAYNDIRQVIITLLPLLMSVSVYHHHRHSRHDKLCSVDNWRANG